MEPVDNIERMTRCLNLTRSGEYAIAALSRLTLAGRGAPVSVEALAAAQGLPKAFLSKILRDCVRAGLVRARKGAAGGVSLARDPEGISLLSVIEACEDAYARSSCVFYAARPCPGVECPVYCPLRREEEALREGLKRTTLADMARALGVHPDAAGAGSAELPGGLQWKRE